MTAASPSYLALPTKSAAWPRPGRLGTGAAAVGLDPPAGQEWFELLQRKLLAQFDLPPLLVVAVVGGTNIGKSVIFNQPGRRSGQRRQPAGRRHQTSRLPGAAGLGRSGVVGAPLRVLRAARLAFGRRPVGRRGGEPSLLAERATRCPRGCCCWMPPT